MSRRPILLACLLLLACNALTATARDISVVSWNLQWFPGKSPFARAPARSNHLAEAKADLLRLNPDVFVVQEISNVQAFHDLVSVLTGYTVHVVSNFPRPGGGRGQQVAIASRFPARSAWAATWHQTTNRPPRGYAFAALDVGDELVMVYSLHLKSNRVDTNSTIATCIAKREDAIQQLARPRHEDGQGPGPGRQGGLHRGRRLQHQHRQPRVGGRTNAAEDGRGGVCQRMARGGATRSPDLGQAPRIIRPALLTMCSPEASRSRRSSYWT
jgi:hypothetical protein